MHNTTRVHMIESAADLNKVLPNSLLWNKAFLFLKMLQLQKNNKHAQSAVNFCQQKMMMTKILYK